jgi:hypothetical protein
MARFTNLRAAHFSHQRRQRLAPFEQFDCLDDDAAHTKWQRVSLES